jgi:S1-C subfamily serine protease
MAVVWIALVLLSVRAIAGDTTGLRLTGLLHWIVLAARQDREEAVDLARTYGALVNGVRAVRSGNGWFAVLLGPAPVASMAEAKTRYQPQLWFPSDAYLSRGERFLETVFEAPPSPILAFATYEGLAPVTLQYDDIIVILDRLRKPNGSRVPIATARSADVTLFTTQIEDNPSEAPHSQVRIIKLDPQTEKPQVIFTYFWGGAHCCTVTRIGTQVGATTWRIVDGGVLDGDGYGFEDIDGDGVAEMLSGDNSFLYAFASYAESFTPPKVQQLRHGVVHDVTREPRTQNFVRRELRRMEDLAGKNPELWKRNGFLAGWVASKALVGEVDEAWQRMLASFDQNSDWVQEECAVPLTIDKCPKDKRRNLSFPEALHRHFVANGYPAPFAVPSSESTSRGQPSIAGALRKPDLVEQNVVKSTGSGFFVSTEGHLLTNAHVVDSCAEVRVSSGQDGPSSARVIARDVTNDLALLKTSTTPPRVATFRYGVRLGEDVAVFGFPLAGLLAAGGNFTLGNVTALAGLRDDSRMLQISAPVQPGNSGGPLLDETGAVVGIVVSKLNALKLAAATDDIPQNVNFAIKASVVQTFAEAQGLRPRVASPDASLLRRADLADAAKSFTRLVECLR